MYQTTNEQLQCAIKVPYLGDLSQRDEIKALYKIHEKGDMNKIFVVKPLGHFDLLGHVALQMELVRGNLQDVMKQKALTEEQKRHIACFITRGLACAHKVGIPHRDIKPLNILLDDNCIPKICDWGMTRAGG